MSAFLNQPRWRWAFRALALVASWLVVTQGLGMAWHGNGHAFLVAMFVIAWLAFAYAADAFLDVALSFAPKPAPAKGSYQGTIPPLSPARQAKVRKLHQAMAEAGVFAPEVPDPALAFAGFALDKHRIDWLGVLNALAEADYYYPECEPARWGANMVYDHIPARWQDPPDGKVLAYLWEDENIIFSWIEESSLPVLGKASSRATPWFAMTEAMLPLFAQAGILPR